MKVTKKVILAALAATLATGSLSAPASAATVAVPELRTAAQAASPMVEVRDHRHHDRRYHDHRYHDRKHYNRGNWHNHRRDWRPPPPPRVHYHRWNRGDRFQRAWAPHYQVIPTYHYPRYHLYQPHHGHHWVRSGNDAVMVALTTGIVAAIVAGAFY